MKKWFRVLARLAQGKSLFESRGSIIYLEAFTTGTREAMVSCLERLLGSISALTKSFYSLGTKWLGKIENIQIWYCSVSAHTDIFLKMNLSCAADAVC